MSNGDQKAGQVDWQGWLMRWDAQQAGYVPERERRSQVMLDVLEALPGDHLFDNLAEVDEAARPSGSQRLEPDEP